MGPAPLVVVDKPPPNMSSAGRARFPLRTVWAGVTFGLLATLAFAAPDPKKILGPAACAECHPTEVEAWKTTKHFKSFRELPRHPDTAAMLAKLGIANVKTEASCLECHFLVKEVDGVNQASAAISCESCHSAGQDWIKTHGDYGPGMKRDTESAEHREARRAQAVAAGMVTPHDLHGLGSACYRCHVVMDEKLVNGAGHPAGSVGFELLAWTQGEIRHNVLFSENRENREAPLEIRRRLFVLGLILETEFSFRAVSHATEKAGYGVGYARRADAARKLLEKVQTLAPTPQLEAVLQVARPVALRLNNAAELAAAADRLTPLGRDFAKQVTGDQLAALDALLPTADQYRGTPYHAAPR